MRDRWDDEDELERDRLRDDKRLAEPTLGEHIDNAVRKVVTSLIIAAGLIALGIYGAGSDGGGSTVPDYQIVTASDGRVYRLNTDSGSIVACQNNDCWLMQRGSRDLENEPPADEAPKQNAAAAQPQAVTAQPAPAQLPAPQNSAAPAAR